MNNISLSIRNTKLSYPMACPFDASIDYKEFSHLYINKKENNAIYDTVRQCLIDMKLDKQHIAGKGWSPFSDFIVPGNTIVIKPNLVLNMADNSLQEHTTTHPSVVRPIIDYCWLALKGSGNIIVGDAPSSETDFNTLIEITGYKEMITILQNRGVNVELKDFRAVKVVSKDGIWVGEQKNNKDVPTSQIINLGSASLFYDKRFLNTKFHGGGYDISETTKHHSGTRQEYCVSKYILNADVVISVPKLKTHRKAGLTCCLKNLVGINCDKNYLPHFAMGSKNMGGDEMPAIDKKNIPRVKFYNWIREYIIANTWKIIGNPAVLLLKQLHKNDDKQNKSINSNNNEVDLAKWLHNKLSGQNVSAGAWQGNETISCMILDLNKIFLCCNRDGSLCDQTDRKIFYVVDGVSVGVGNGPVDAIQRQGNLIATGWNGFEIDKTILGLLNIDPDCIELYRRGKEQNWIYLRSKKIRLLNGKEITEKDGIEMDFIPPSGWVFNKLRL